MSKDANNRCRKCKKVFDFYKDLDDFTDYIKDEHDDYDSKYPDVRVCLSCAIDIYEERLNKWSDPDYGKPNRNKEEDPNDIDPSEDYWYDD